MGVLLFPIAWIAYRRNLSVLQNDLSGHLALSASNEQDIRHIALLAALGHGLVLTIPTLLAPMLPYQAQAVIAARTIGCTVGAIICWHLLGKIDILMKARG